MENKIYDANGNPIELNKSDFTLCQTEMKISDRKFETKVTTFAKDAFRRFCKNKASLVAAIIILVLTTLAVFVPAISDKNISTIKPAERYLLPKIRKAGSGFWDGTRVYSNMVYDTVNERPVETSFKKNAILEYTNFTKEGDNFVNHYVNGAYGGKFMVSTSNTGISDDLISKSYTYYTHDYNDTDNYIFEYSLANIDNINGNKLGYYRVYMEYTDGTETKTVYFTDWNNSYGAKSIDISAYLKTNSIDVAEKGRIGFEVQPSPSSITYIIFDEWKFTTSSTDQSVINKLKEFSMDDANTKMGLQKNNAGVFPQGYWQITGNKNLYKANVIYCSFIYDPYEAVYGENYMSDLGGSELMKYVANGWCEYDTSVGAESFKVLSDKCPVTAVYSQKRIVLPEVTIFTVEADVIMYKYYGYDSMPKFLLGTDVNGFDIVKQTFYGLRISLILSLVVSAVCLSFGLVWGAISGYFGGNIDLMMERFCDILGGLPWIVLMTLMLLHLGRNLGTMALAMCVTGWMAIAGRTRTQFYRFKGREYVLASRTLGASDKRLIFKHILPNAMGTIVTAAVLMIPGTISRESTLAYLNIGVQGTNSLGNILSNNQQYINSYPWLLVFPSIILALIMISFNLFGNGLRDALNPSLKGSE